MFANVRPSGREYRMTPCCLEKAAGRASAPPKSPALVTRTQRCASTWRVRGDGFAIRRDDLRKVIHMYTQEKETARPEQARAADEAAEAGNLNGNGKTPAIIIGEANAIAASIPYMMTRERKRSAADRFLGLWLQALAASRGEELAV
jgi:hypothetical protein